MKKQAVTQQTSVPATSFPMDLKKQIEEAAYCGSLQRGLPPESAENDWIET